MNRFFFLFALVLAVFAANAQPVVPVTGDITTNTTWVPSKIYLLTNGFHYVRNNAILTIKPGTLIKSDGGVLVITRGSKIIANGTAQRPIVFTSNKPAGSRVAGDNGGIVILGRAAINDPAGERLIEGGLDSQLGLYGPGPGQTAQNNESSGSLRFVRIEFGGVFYLPNNEVNSLTMGGVGSGTVIENVMVSYGQDDGFEWFGGTNNVRNIISYAMLDDDMDTDFGYTGNVQFGLILRDPNIADISTSNLFESDNDNTGTLNTPFTSCTFSNITAFGAIRTVNPVNSFNSLYGRGLHVRRSSRQNLYNSVVTGMPEGLRLDGVNTVNAAANGDLKFKNNVLAAIKTASGGAGQNVRVILPSGVLPPAGFDPNAWFTSNGNTSLNAVEDLGYNDPFNATSPRFNLLSGSPLSTGADFTGLPSFFTPTTFRGAFSSAPANFATCWTEYNPQNANYNTAPIVTFNYGITPTGSAAVGATLTATGGGAGATYKWFRDGVALSGPASTNSFIVASTPGSYRCRILNTRGCQAFTPTVSVGFALTQNTNDLDSEVAQNVEGIEIYPNPAVDFATVNVFSAGAGRASVTVSDMMGRIVSEKVMQLVEGTNALNIEVSTLPRGIYQIVVKEGNNVVSTSLSVE